MAQAAASISKKSLPLPRPFLAFLGGLGISNVGDAIYILALPWIAYELTHSSIIMGTLYATEILPIILFGALAGVFIDRWNRKHVMLSADVIRAMAVASIPALHALDILQIWHLYAVAFILAVCTLAFDIANVAIIPEIAGDDLTRANARHQSVSQIAGLLGPVLAGLIIAQLGGFNALMLDAVSFGGTFLALLFLPNFKQQNSTRTASTIMQDMKDGFKWLTGNTVIKVLAIQASIGNFGFSMVGAIMVYYLRSTLNLSAELSGLNYTIMGIGGLLGSVAIVPLARRYSRGALYPTLLLFGLCGYLIMAFVHSWWASGLGWGMGFACNVAWVVLSTSVRQEQIPGELMGRVLGVSRMFSVSAMPIGATVGGIMVGFFNPMYIFLFAAFTKGIEFLIAALSPMRKL